MKTQNSPTAVIHFETLRNNKTRWVKQAHRDGKKRIDWVEETLNNKSQALNCDRSRICEND